MPVIHKIERFLESKSAPGILLFIAAALSLVMKNSPLEWLYAALLKTPVVVQIGALAVDKPLLLWINDGLMAVFFLLVGLEIKREILVGHLSKRSQIVLPAIAAFGGIAVPALIYAFVNRDNPVGLSGWAVPAATDIAFVLGIVTLLGNRVPSALKITLLAIAVIDDLAAIVIIALFYTSDLSVISLVLAGIGTALMIILNRMGVSRLSPYMVIGGIVWLCVLKSGVHATLAGVLAGLIIPMHARHNEREPSPLIKLEHSLLPWVNFAVLPLFAFANAGISFAGMTFHALLEPITLGIIAGLAVGKQAGVMLFTAIAVRFGVCKLPKGVSWTHFYGGAVLTGVGFTMSLFIGTLAFSSPGNEAAVRLGVLVASCISGLIGYLVLRARGRH